MAENQQEPREHSLEEREYRGEDGQIHHHTNEYMDRHGGEGGSRQEARSGGDDRSGGENRSGEEGSEREGGGIGRIAGAAIGAAVGAAATAAALAASDRAGEGGNPQERDLAAGGTGSREGLDSGYGEGSLGTSDLSSGGMEGGGREGGGREGGDRSLSDSIADNNGRGGGGEVY